MSKIAFSSAAILVASLGTSPALAEPFWSGDWSLTLGAAVLTLPEFQGDDDYMLRVQPIISLGRQGTAKRFSSRNDNISLGLVDTGNFRAGVAGKVVFGRDGDDAADIKGLDPVRFGGELGGFAEFYPTAWMRLRGEVRHGIRSHDGVVADVSADFFTNITPTVQVSAGPRVTYASQDYHEAWYGVNASEAVASGLSEYHPDSGFHSVGLGGAINWDVTEKVKTSLFGEYARLVGPAADSSLVNERGSKNQFTVGVSATYRFDFSL